MLQSISHLSVSYIDRTSLLTSKAEMAFSSPSKTSPGKLSYLPSDVEEDPGIIDFDDPQYDFLDKDEFYLCEDIFVDDPSAYDKAYQWLSSVFEPKDHDPYFDIQQPVNTTPGR